MILCVLKFENHWIEGGNPAGREIFKGNTHGKVSSMRAGTMLVLYFSCSGYLEACLAHNRCSTNICAMKLLAVCLWENYLTFWNLDSLTVKW